MSDAWIGAAGLLAAGAITPGPNNFVVMTAGALGGWRRAIPAIAGIVLGSLALLALLATGAGAVFAAEPRLPLLIAALACAYLTWLGGKLIAGSFAARELPGGTASDSLPTGTLGLFMFQFLNPKSWLIVATLISTGASLASLAALTLVVPLACLLMWASFGLLINRRLARPEFRAWFDRAMGAVFVASAALLFHSRLALP